MSNAETHVSNIGLQNRPQTLNKLVWFQIIGPKELESQWPSLLQETKVQVPCVIAYTKPDYKSNTENVTEDWTTELSQLGEK